MSYFTAKCLCSYFFKIFAILHNIVASNNLQHSIKQANGKKQTFHVFALYPTKHVTHPGHLF